MNWTFDWNEWFMIVTSLVGAIVIFSLRKHFQSVVFILIWIYSIALVETIDYALAATPFFVYFCGDNLTYEPAVALIHLFLYPSFSFIFLFFYDKWKIRGKKTIPYLLLWNVFSVFFEWINVKNGVITYIEWKIYYSIPTYPIACFLLIKVYHFIQKHLSDPRLTNIVKKGY